MADVLEEVKKLVDEPEQTPEERQKELKKQEKGEGNVY